MPDDVLGNSHRGAYRKGYLAGFDGKTPRANPYSLQASPVVRGLHYTWKRGYAAGVVALAAKAHG